MIGFVRRQIAMSVSGLSAAELDECLTNVRQRTGGVEIVFHLDGTVSGMKAGRRTTLGTVSEFL